MGHGAGKTLLASAARTTTPGDTAVLNASVGNAVSLLLSTTAKTGTTPTLTCTVQWSFDKTTWFAGPTGDNFTAVNDTAVVTEFKDVVLRAPYLRVHYVIGGTATPGYTFSVNAFVRS